MRRRFFAPWLEVDASPDSVQRILPQSELERYEGVDISPSGGILAIATSDNNSVLLFRRRADGRFEDKPHQAIKKSDLDYPHDVSFSSWSDGGLLAVARRVGVITVFAKDGADGGFASSAAFEISGEHSKLAFSDGVAFVPPQDRYLAACCLELGTISFFRTVSLSPPVFQVEPELVLKHESIHHPDGLAFSRCGTWLAVANHGRQTVTVFRRRTKGDHGLGFFPEPALIIEDPRFRYPHSVAFTPKTNHLIVTNAGANYFIACAPPSRDARGTQRLQGGALQIAVQDEGVFREVNMTNKMEGGPKGVAVSGRTLAVCSPQIGVKIYSFREGWRLWLF
jgi:hypothetical protein